MGSKQEAMVRDPIRRAHKRHRMPRSQTSGIMLAFGRLLMPAYLRLVLKLDGIDVRRIDRLSEALRDMQEGRTRLIVAFRHPYGDESQLLFQTFNNLVPRAARRVGFRLRRRPHLRYLHDYAVPLWGDAFIRFLLPRIGAVPVYHVKFDATSLKLIRRILLDDRYPLALAPEGQVSYRSERLPRVEQGTVRMGFWTVKDLEKAGRSERVVILPLSIHYRFSEGEERKLWHVMDRLDRLLGFTASPVLAKYRTGPSSIDALRRRLDALENRVLQVAEAFYAKSYGFVPAEPIPSAVPGRGAATIDRRPGDDDGDADGRLRITVSTPEAAADRRRRWDALQQTALAAAEHQLGLRGATPDEDVVQRVYRIRQECWDRIYPETPIDGLSPLETSLAHRRAGEAWYAMRHMELCDLLYYLDAEYEQGADGRGADFDRIVEMVYSLDDLVSRLMGGDFSNRLNLIRKRALVLPGPLVDLTSYSVKGEKVSREACARATDELSQAFEGLIREAVLTKAPRPDRTPKPKRDDEPPVRRPKAPAPEKAPRKPALPEHDEPPVEAEVRPKPVRVAPEAAPASSAPAAPAPASAPASSAPEAPPADVPKKTTPKKKAP